MALVDFLLTHWILSSLLFVGLLALLWNEWINRLPFGVLTLDHTQVVFAMNHQEARLIDLRSSLQFQEGHVVNAVSVPLSALQEKLVLLQKDEKKPVILVCETGQESVKAARILRGMQKESVPPTPLSILEGGMRAWRDAALPLVRL